ncbi:MAG TPA: hypothetical protein VKA16_05275 [Burkholderiales bacterium]|nr:hypothetical protein [Burkholderiales bacterium]
MSMHDKTLKLVTNLDRAGIEARLAEVRSGAREKNLSEVTALLDGIEGEPQAQMQERVQNALKLLRGKPEHGAISALLELVELNLPNLK